MNIPENARIWRDALSAYTFHVGVEGKHGRFYCWFSLEQDAISECLGPDAYARAKALAPGKPVPLKDVFV